METNFTQFGVMMLKICWTEFDRPEKLCVSKTENGFYVVANIGKNLKGSKESVQHEI